MSGHEEYRLGVGLVTRPVPVWVNAATTVKTRSNGYDLETGSLLSTYHPVPDRNCHGST